MGNGGVTVEFPPGRLGLDAPAWCCRSKAQLVLPVPAPPDFTYRAWRCVGGRPRLGTRAGC